MNGKNKVLYTAEVYAYNKELSKYRNTDDIPERVLLFVFLYCTDISFCYVENGEFRVTMAKDTAEHHPVYLRMINRMCKDEYSTLVKVGETKYHHVYAIERNSVRL